MGISDVVGAEEISRKVRVPVDKSRIRLFQEGKLSGPEEIEVADLISRFAAWRDANTEILEERNGITKRENDENENN